MFFHIIYMSNLSCLLVYLFTRLLVYSFTRLLVYLFTLLILSDFQFVEEIRAAAELVEHEEHVAHVHVDAALKRGVEFQVA